MRNPISSDDLHKVAASIDQAADAAQQAMHYQQCMIADNTYMNATAKVEAIVQINDFSNKIGRMMRARSNTLHSVAADCERI